MFVEFHIEGLQTPHLIAIEKADKLMVELQKRGKKFHLGKTLS